VTDVGGHEILPGNFVAAGGEKPMAIDRRRVALASGAITLPGKVVTGSH
jgi:hypothetical protein